MGERGQAQLCLDLRQAADQECRLVHSLLDGAERVLLDRLYRITGPSNSCERVLPTEPGDGWTFRESQRPLKTTMCNRGRDSFPHGKGEAMIPIIDLKAELEKLTMLRGRGPFDGAEKKREAIVRLAPYRDGSIFASKFSGDSGWERHRQGDEIVEVVDGAATLYLLTEDGQRSVALRAGLMVIVPMGMWHRFDSPDGVTLITATPQPTDHPATDVEDPRTLD
jgi:mannose-6-phosphate isomerase-like protein (cupin superfamily)